MTFALCIILAALFPALGHMLARLWRENVCDWGWQDELGFHRENEFAAQNGGRTAAAKPQPGLGVI